MQRKFLISLLLLISVDALAAPAETRLRLGTTTSTQDSGLLDHLLPPFEKQCGCKVDVIAVGTGKALELGRRGDVDVVLVHAPKLEEAFVADGWGIDRRHVMHNDFVVIGPASDPAGIKQAKTAPEALKRIANHHSTFISRGDHSGTHEKELQIWQTAGIKPGGPSHKEYIEAGQGMGEVLTMANEKNAYTLSDRGTFAAYKGKLALRVLFEGDSTLMNPYSVIAVNPAKNPSIKKSLAKRFVDFLTGKAGQDLIKGYKRNDQQLFFVP